MSAKNGKSNSSPKGQRGHATGCKRAYGGSCEVRPGARGVMAPGEAAVIRLTGCWVGMSESKSGTAYDTPLAPEWAQEAFYISVK